jgi:hypothetical protein
MKPIDEISLERIIYNLRKSDVEESHALYGQDHEKTIRDSVKLSSFSGILFDPENNPVLVCGVCPCYIQNLGIPWMVGTDRMEDLPKRFLTEQGMKFKKMFHTWYPELYNVILKSNHKTIKWLVKLGYVFDKETLMINGHEALGFRSQDQACIINVSQDTNAGSFTYSNIGYSQFNPGES